MKKDIHKHIKIGIMGDGTTRKNELIKAIDTLSKDPQLACSNERKYAHTSDNSPKITLTEQIMQDYERRKQQEQIKFLEETGYYDMLLKKFKNQATIQESEEQNEK